MRRVAPAVALMATTAVALAAHGPSAVQAARKPKPGGDGQIHFIPALPNVPDENVDPEVAKVTKMSKEKLKKRLLELYTENMRMDERFYYPRGSVDAMQKLLKMPESKDPEKKELNDFMNRYAYLLAGTLELYKKYSKLKLVLQEPTLHPDEYKREVAKLQPLVDQYLKQNLVLSTFLKRGARELKRKWGKDQATKTKMQNVAVFLSQLPGVYEAQRLTIILTVALAKLRFLANPDRQTDLVVMIEDPRYSETANQHDAAFAVFRRRVEEARSSGNKSVKDNVLEAGYLTLLPFGSFKLS
ncbi:hypothetical protein Emag_006546 [Eimeria magna]